MSENFEDVSAPVLEFDHNVIEHLGIRLYQNKIPNVLAELLANSWDADANLVEIETGHTDAGPFIAVVDNGFGMDLEIIRSRYLVVGKPKRKTPKEKSPGGRRPMGRKGIGKLAPFGIARLVDVVSFRNGELNWFTLKLSDILASGPGHTKYAPPFHLTNSTDQGEWRKAIKDAPEKVSQFINGIISGDRLQGTLVLLSSLSVNELILDEDLKNSLVDKFTVILAREDFTLQINGKEVDKASTLPAFEFRIPADKDFETEIVDGKEVRYWVGFVGSAKWSSEQAGVGVYVHGKIGQDRPFYFGSRGKEIFQRYLYAVVEADWIDELDQDLISTDRTGIDWSNPAVQKLKSWGARKVLNWLEEYGKFRADRHFSEIKEITATKRAENLIPNFTESENNAIDRLVAEATKDLSKSQESTRDEFVSAVSQAWINLPSRNFVRQLWDSIGKPNDTSPFITVIEKLQEHSVPESMGLALTFAQRAYALSVLTQLIHRKSETKLQALIEDFPWILQPRGDLLTANQYLKTTVEKAADSLSEKDYDRAGRVIKGMSEKERADFVFLSDIDQKSIKVVEIKSPNLELSQENRRQLGDYIDFTEQYHSSAKIDGLLVGRIPPNGMNIPDTRILAKSWDDILLECRAAYVSLLAAMLDQADPSPDDIRIRYVHEFGGEAVWGLLDKLAENNPKLKNLMEKHNKLLIN
jgi:hypothetical protein